MHAKNTFQISQSGWENVPLLMQVLEYHVFLHMCEYQPLKYLYQWIDQNGCTQPACSIYDLQSI